MTKGKMSRAEDGPAGRTLRTAAEALTLTFDPAWITPTVLAEINGVLSQCPSLPASATKRARAAAVRATLENTGALSGWFSELGMERVAASRLAAFVNSRVAATINRERLTNLRVAEVEWLYSGAGCTPPGELLGPNDERHKVLNGRRFRLADGLLSDGTRLWPGVEEGCKCRLIPIVAV